MYHYRVSKVAERKKKS